MVRPHTLRTRGFTLVEVLIVMVIVAVLAMIAVPTYNDSVRKSRRSDAIAALTALQQAQERWRGNNPSYTTSFEDLGLSDSSPSDYYTLSLAAPGEGENALATGYIATATAKSGTTQADDAQCGKMSLRMRGGNLAYAGAGTSGTLEYAETHPCWAR